MRQHQSVAVTMGTTLSEIRRAVLKQMARTGAQTDEGDPLCSTPFAIASAVAQALERSAQEVLGVISQLEKENLTSRPVPQDTRFITLNDAGLREAQLYAQAA